MADNLGVNKMKYDNAHNVGLPQQALEMVRDHTEEVYDSSELRVVWFGFVLGNWKALIVSTRPDGHYYEVTYNKEKSEVYIDVYLKTKQHVVLV